MNNQGPEIEYEEDELYGDSEEDEEDEDEDGYCTKDPLPPARSRVYTTEDLHDLIHEGMIDLDPVWQREVVWKDSSQSHLIDSLFHNIYIPPLVFVITHDEDGDELKVCVDGKQRLTSIQKFIDGQISCRHPTTKKPYWFTTSSTAKNRVPLSKKWKDDFLKKIIPCVEYEGINDAQIRDIFQRVQMGVALRPAERLQALSTPRADWLGQLLETFVRSDNGVATHVEIASKFGGDFYLIAMAICSCDYLENQPTATATMVEKWLKRTDTLIVQFKSDIEWMFNKLIFLASEKRYNKVFRSIKKRVAPAEFVFICVAIYLCHEIQAEDEEIATAIYTLRKGMRDNIQDIRMNNSVTQQTWPFIFALRDDVTASFKPVKPIPSGKGRKRKKDDEDGDYRQVVSKRQR